MRRYPLSASTSLTHPHVLGALGLLVFSGSALANPQGGTVSAGAAAIQGQGTPVVQVNQQTGRAVVDWQSFNIAPGEVTRFEQPSPSSAILNRIHDQDPSQILGSLSANGTVALVNPNGMVFGPGSRIDVGSLIATSADIRNEHFMAGRMHFEIPGEPQATVVNRGDITAGEAGLVGLVAPNAINHGAITARLGKVALASGDRFTLDLYGDGLLAVEVGDHIVSQLVENSGRIEAEGGTVTLTAAAAGDAVDSLILHTGVIEATSAGSRKGAIALYAEGSHSVEGNRAEDQGIREGASTVLVSGTLDASGRGPGETGGTIAVLGDQVGLLAGARLDASGDTGGGTVHIGGEYQGKGATPTSVMAYVEPFSLIMNDALTSGNGGETILWADGDTYFYGTILARGGSVSGDGGFTETSGHRYLDAQGFVDLTAPHGGKGTWLLDPTNVTIFGNVTSVFDSTDRVGYWNFDEGAGGTANDSTASTNDGTLTNGPTWSATVAPTPQANSNSLNFAGGGTADYVVANTSAWTTFSFSVWFRADALTTADGHGYHIVGLTHNGVPFGEYLGNLGVNQNGAMVFYSYDGSSLDSLSANGAVVPGQWYHAVGVNKANDSIKLYLNGVLQESTPFTTTFTGWGSGPKVTISGRVNGTGGTTFPAYFDGLIDDVQLYDTDLSLNDVQELYGSRFTVAGMETMSATADVAVLATNDITLDLGGDTLNLASGRNIAMTTTNGDILSASAGTIETAGTGSITLTAGDDINLTHDVDFNATGSGTVTFRANNSILSPGGGDITTQGGAVTLNANRDGVGAGAVALTNMAITTNGGNVIIGGGADPSANPAIGTAANAEGIALDNGDISTGAGSISIRGRGDNAGSRNYGAVIRSGSVVQATSGTITITGQGGSAADRNHGVQVVHAGTQVGTTDGDIIITGTGGNGTVNGNHGVYMGEGGSLVTSATGDIVINATGGGGTDTNLGFAFNNGGSVTLTGNGTITVTGAGGAGPFSSDIWAASMSAGMFGGPAATGTVTLVMDSHTLTNLTAETDGDIVLRPRSAGTTVGIAGGAGTLDLSSTVLGFMDAGDELIMGRADGTGAITANAYANWSAIAGTGVQILSDTGVISVNGAQAFGARDFTITTNADPVIGAGVTGSGILTLATTSAGTTMGLAGGAGTMNYSAGDLTNLGNGWSQWNIGGVAHTGALTVGAKAWSDPVSFLAAAAGNITVSGAQTAGAGSDATFTFSGPTTLGANVDLSTATGGIQDITFSEDVTLAGNAQILAGNGDILFSGSIDGAFDLTLTTAGDVDFSDDVGAGTALDAIAIANAADVTFAGELNAADFTLTNGTGAVVVTDAADITGNIDLTTTGVVTFDDDLVYGGDVAVDAGASDITFNGTLNGPGDMELTTTNDITLAADVGGVTRLGNVFIDPWHFTAGAFNAASFTLTNGTGIINFTGAGLNTTGIITIETNDDILGAYAGINGMLDAGAGDIAATVSFSGLDIGGAGANLLAGYIGVPGAATQAMANLISIDGISHPGLPGSPAYRFAGFIIGTFPPGSIGGGGGSQDGGSVVPDPVTPIGPVPQPEEPHMPPPIADIPDSHFVSSMSDPARIERSMLGMTRTPKLDPTDDLLAPALSEATATPELQSHPYARLIAYSRDLYALLGCSHDDQGCYGEETP